MTQKKKGVKRVTIVRFDHSDLFLRLSAEPESGASKLLDGSSILGRALFEPG